LAEEVLDVRVEKSPPEVNPEGKKLECEGGEFSPEIPIPEASPSIKLLLS